MWVLENDLGWVTGVMALVNLDDKDREAPLSRNKFRLLTYIKHFPEVMAQMQSKQRGMRRSIAAGSRYICEYVCGYPHQAGPTQEGGGNG